MSKKGSSKLPAHMPNINRNLGYSEIHTPYLQNLGVWSVCFMQQVLSATLSSIPSHQDSETDWKELLWLCLRCDGGHTYSMLWAKQNSTRGSFKANQPHLITPGNKNYRSQSVSEGCGTRSFTHPLPPSKPLSQPCSKYVPYLEKIFSKSSSVLVKGRFLTKSLPDSDRSSSSSSSLFLRCHGLSSVFAGTVSFGVFPHRSTLTYRPSSPKPQAR